MKWYQPIECDNTVDNPLISGFDNLDECGFEELNFLKGEKIEQWPQNIVFISDKQPMMENQMMYYSLQRCYLFIQSDLLINWKKTIYLGYNICQ